MSPWFEKSNGATVGSPLAGAFQNASKLAGEFRELVDIGLMGSEQGCDRGEEELKNEN